MKKVSLFVLALLAVCVFAPSSPAQDARGPWTRNGAAAEAYIVGSPWTLEQSGAAVGLKSADYCDANGVQVPNPSVERMQPYYFPFITGHGRHLQAILTIAPKILMRPW